MYALISSLSETLIAQVVECQFARDVWLPLETSFASVSQVRVVQTQLQLVSLKKGLNSIFSYHRRAKTLANTMATTGHPFPPSEFVPYLLASLGIEYDAIVSSVITHLDLISLDKLLGHLLTHEARLLCHSNLTLFHT